MNLRQLERDLEMPATEVSTSLFEQWLGENIYASREYITRIRKAILQECWSKYGENSCAQLRAASVQKIRLLGVQSHFFSSFDHLDIALKNAVENQFLPDSYRWYLSFVGMYLLWYGFSFVEMSNLKKTDVSDAYPLIQKGNDTIPVNSIVIRLLRQWKTLSTYRVEDGIEICKPSNHLFRSGIKDMVSADTIEYLLSNINNISLDYVRQSGQFWRCSVSQIDGTSFISESEKALVNKSESDYKLWKKVFYPNEGHKSVNWVDTLIPGNFVVVETIQNRLKYTKEMVVAVSNDTISTHSHVFNKSSLCDQNEPYCKMLDAQSSIVQSLLVEYGNSFGDNYGISALLLGRLYRKLLADGSGDNKMLDALELAIATLEEKEEERQKNFSNHCV